LKGALPERPRHASYSSLYSEGTADGLALFSLLN
jgi:hypothetical protein